MPAHLTPLPELRRAYRGEPGGLYPGRRNVPPAPLRAAAREAAAGVVPLDRIGRASSRGRIVLLGLGMSNTTREFSAFKRLADRHPRKAPSVIVVDGAQGGRDATAWTDRHGEPWAEVRRRLTRAGVTRPQVQVLWIKQALAGPRRYGRFPRHARVLADHLIAILRRARREYPHLRLAFLSSRTYGGWATTPLNPEPFAYESAFAVRRALAAWHRSGAARPVALWGPYLWADGFRWRRSDFAGDGTHPSPVGIRKVATALMAFFRDSEFARRWFVLPTP